MRNIKLLRMLALLFVGLQMNVLQAADYGVEETKDEVGQFINYTELYPHLAEGFDILRVSGQDVPTFEGFMQQRLANVNEDAEINAEDNFETILSDAIMDAQDVIFTGMKIPFFKFVSSTILEDPVVLYEPVFNYIMKYSIGFARFNLPINNNQFMSLVVQEWVNEKNNNGENLLYDAAAYNAFEVGKLLFDLGSRIDNRNISKGYTPLHIAVKNESVEMVRLLLACKVNLHDLDRAGFTPLHLAAMSDEPEAVEIANMLIDEHIARGDRAGLSFEFDIRDHEDGFYMIEDYFNTCPYGNYNSSTFNGDYNHAKIICNMGFTPLLIAAGYNSVGVAQALLNKGVSVDEVDSCGKSALRISGEFNSLAVAQFLIDCGINLYIKNSDGYSVLHMIAFAGDYNTDPQFIKLLIAAGIDVNDPTSDGADDGRCTPLHLVVIVDNSLMQSQSNVRLNVAQLLIDAGANLYAQDIHGETVLDIANTQEMKSLLNRAVRNQAERDILRSLDEDSDAPVTKKQRTA